MTWDDAPQPPPARPDLRGWIRTVGRGAALLLLLLMGLAVLLPMRLVERPLFGLRRPLTPWITQGVCHLAFRCLGMRRRVRGRPMQGTGAAVANHASWLDVLALNAGKRIYFVAKSEIARWPGIGVLARVTGTVFIRRDPRDAATQRALFEARLRARHRLLFFPEGTSTDGRRVLPFKPTLFAAFFSDGLPGMEVQPVTLAYHAPEGERLDFYGWWGDRGFGDHLLAVLSVRRPGRVEVIYHPPLAVSTFADRKALARAAWGAVRGGLEAEGLMEDAGGTAPRTPRDVSGRKKISGAGR